MYYVLYMCVMFGEMCVFWIFLLSFQTCIVLNSVNCVFDTCIVYWVDVPCFMYCALDICIVF